MTLVLHIVRFVALDIVGEVFYWPIWWYTRGLWEVLKWVGRGLRDEWIVLALGPWLRSMFTPMYADYSFAGRAISFVFRIIILGFRLVKFSIWLAWYFIGALLYVGLPAAAVYLLVMFMRK